MAGGRGDRELVSARGRGPFDTTWGDGAPMCALPHFTLGCHPTPTSPSLGLDLRNPPSIVRQEEGAGAGGRLRQCVCGLVAEVAKEPQIRKKCSGTGQGSDMYVCWGRAESRPQPRRTSPPHSPQLVWVDVDPCRQTAAASDKA